MISTIPPIYPNELLYSYILRYHKVSGNTNFKETIIELFKTKRIYPNIFYTTHLQAFIDQISNLNIDFECLIDKHTLLNFFTPFMQSSDVLELKKIIYKKNSYILKNMIGIRKKFLIEHNKINICIHCYEEDKQKYGVAYIHKEHQLYGNYICIKHNQLLSSIPINENSNCFIDINNIKKEDFEHKNPNEIHFDKLLVISKSINQLLNGKFRDLNICDIKDKYEKMLKIKGYKCDKTNQKKLYNDFINFYSKDLLDELKCYPYKEKNNKTWIELITQKEYRKVFPTLHILFINFLFEDINQFYDFKSDFYKPFGDGPWPCLNKVANHYKDEIVSHVELHQSNGNIYGTFECDCGFKYTRIGPDYDGKNRYHISKIENYGFIWEEKLNELILSNDCNVGKIARIMKCSSTTVIKYSDKLSLNQFSTKMIDNLNNNTKARDIKINSNEIEKRKSKIKEYIKSNPNSTRTQIQKDLSKEYLYFYRNDREWFEDNLPIPLKPGTNGGRRVEDWRLKDEEISSKVLEIIKEILDNNTMVRITKTSLSQRINYSYLAENKVLNKMPKTKSIINEYAESKNDYKKRRILHTIENLINNNEKIEISKLSAYFSHSIEEYYEVKDFINKILEDYLSVNK